MAIGSTISGATQNVGALTLLLVSFVAYVGLRGRLGAYLDLAVTPASPPAAADNTSSPRSLVPALPKPPRGIIAPEGALPYTIVPDDPAPRHFAPPDKTFRFTRPGS